MAQTLAGIAVLSRAVDSVAPIQVLLVAGVAVLAVPRGSSDVVFGGQGQEPICGNQRRDQEKKRYGRHGEDEEDD